MRRHAIWIAATLLVCTAAAAITYSQAQKADDQGPFFVFYVDQATVGEKVDGKPFGDLMHVRRALNLLHEDGFEFVATEYTEPGRLMVICRRR